MAYDELSKRIAKRLTEVKLSARKASMRAGLSPDYIRDLGRKHSAPKHPNIVAIAKVLELPEQYLLDAVEVGAQQPMLQPRFVMKTVYVKGAVQAGVFREALEWNPSDWFAITVPIEDDYAGVERFGLEVRGPSMNRLYPEGTFVVVVRFQDIARTPEPGERVVVLRRQRGGADFEATLKEYDRDARGRHLLWPRSDDPDYQQPFILTAEDLPIGSGAEQMPGLVRAGRLEDDGEEVIVSALVTGSWRPERRG